MKRNGWKESFPDKASEIAAHNALVTQRSEADSGADVEEEDLVGYKYDAAFPLIISKLVKPGMRGFMFAAIAGAVISSLASMLNSASTIFTMDVCQGYSLAFPLISGGV